LIAIGIDIHKETSTFYAFGDDGEPLEEFNKKFRRVRSNEKGYGEVTAFLEGKECEFLMENSTKTHDSFWTLRSLGFERLYVAHSTDLALITKSDKKNDDNDAEKLAMYMRVKQQNIDQFRTCYICTPEDMMKRRLCRVAKQEMVEASKYSRRVKAEFLMFGIRCPFNTTTKKAHEWMMEHRDPALAALGRAMEDNRVRIADLNKRITKEFTGDPVYEKLIAIPEFGPVTAGYLASIIVDIRRFASAKELAAYLGLVPRQKDSGETVSHCRITKTGDPSARWLLIQTVFRLVSDEENDSGLKRFFDTKNGGSIAERSSRGLSPVCSRKALVAAANKMCKIIFAILSHDGRSW